MPGLPGLLFGEEHPHLLLAHTPCRVSEQRCLALVLSADATKTKESLFIGALGCSHEHLLINLSSLSYVLNNSLLLAGLGHWR